MYKIPEIVLSNKGLTPYMVNESDFHQDLVFRNDSIIVEAGTEDKRKILLMENGSWKI